MFKKTLFKYCVEHWCGLEVFTTLYYYCDAEDSNHAIEQLMDHYKDSNEKDITITYTYKTNESTSI